MYTEAAIKEHFKEVIFKKYKSFFTHAFINVGCKETAKDLVQETFLTAYQKLSQFEQKSSLETWLFGILNNKILEHYRKKKSESQRITKFEEEEILFHKNGRWKKEWIIDEHFDSEETQNTIIKFLKQCFSKLSEQYQKIFSLKFFSEKSTKEICQLCNVTEDNVWQVLHRGKLQLKICIQSQLKKLK
jgi:RNA polymerase sigma-70 factor (ECF subfamily)